MNPKKEKLTVDRALIEKVAKLARLNLTEDEKHVLIKDFEEILSAFSTLDELDTADVVPSTHAVKIKDALREDEPSDSLTQEDALKNSNLTNDGYFKGPRAT